MYTLIWYFTQSYQYFNTPWEEPVSTYLANLMFKKIEFIVVRVFKAWWTVSFFADPVFIFFGGSLKKTRSQCVVLEKHAYTNGILGKKKHLGVYPNNSGHETPLGGDKQCHTETNVARSNFFYLFKCHVLLNSCLFWVQVAGHLGCNLVF